VGAQQEQEQGQGAARIRRQERHEETRRREPAFGRAETTVNLADDHVERHEHDDRVHVDDGVSLDDEYQLAVNVRAVTSFDPSPIDASTDCSGAGSADVETTFRRLAGPVHAYLRASGAFESEDLLGEVFLDVARGLHRFHGDDDALRGWVFTIAHRRLIDEQRRMQRRRHFLRAQTPRVVPAPEEPLDPTLMAALHSLTPDQREVVVLRFVADLALETVAEMTNRPVGAVKSLQHRALHNLASMLDRTQIS
jgi:RNA polymerase sigma-70 factor (ECF subfamily)